MIFIFEKEDVYAERKLHMFKFNHTVIIKRDGDEGSKKARFYLADSVDGSAQTDKMKRGKLARYLNINGYCPLEQRHIAHPAAPYLDKVANAAIVGYRSIPQYVWHSKPDPRTTRKTHSLLPPETYNCRCVALPVVVDPKKVANAVSMDDAMRQAAFYGDSERDVQNRTFAALGGIVPRGTDEELTELSKVPAYKNPTQDGAPEGATHWYVGSIRTGACWLRLDMTVRPVRCEYWCQGHWLNTRFSALMTTRIQAVHELPKSDDVDETKGLMATHKFTTSLGVVYFGHFVGHGMGSEIWVDIARKMTKISSDGLGIEELKDPVPFSELKPGPIADHDF